MAKAQRQTVDSWIRAGFRALSVGGVQAIKAERLARDLGVSKGSFYWHFKDVPTLARAMIAHWEESATHGIIAAGVEIGGGPRAQLEMLVEVLASDKSHPYGGPAAEPAIRQWGRQEAWVAHAVTQVDAARLGYVEGLMDAAGVDQPAVAARLFYGAGIGLDQFGDGVRPDDLRALLDSLGIVPR